ncbi:MAG: ADP-ribosylglycohydrolase family protein [Acidobacteria bacterium]|nr:ADP-ribosylglycohydrolase family protein [Acidobacteriota bacterium]
MERPGRAPRIDRLRGALLGLAVCDALGTTLEFRAPGTFPALTDLVGGGPFRLQPGQWTDDTSMALCLADSLHSCREFNPRDQMDRYVRWFREGYWSSTGRCFDIGTTVSAALQRFELSGQPMAGDTDPRSAGNGSLMRLAPVPMFFARDEQSAVFRAAQSSRTTHGAPECVDACRYFACLIVAALQGESREQILDPSRWRHGALAPAIDAIRLGSFLRKEPPEIRGTGYVVDCLEAALWAFAQSRSFEHGALLAVNLGDDADTTGAVYGQLAGAFFGEQGIPELWLKRLAMREEIGLLAERVAE